MLHPDNTVCTLLQLYNYKVSFFSDRSPERVFFLCFCRLLPEARTESIFPEHCSPPFWPQNIRWGCTSARLSRSADSKHTPTLTRPSVISPLGLRTMYGDVTPRSSRRHNKQPEQTAAAASPTSIPSGRGRKGRPEDFFFFLTG